MRSDIEILNLRKHLIHEQRKLLQTQLILLDYQEREIDAEIENEKNKENS